MRFSTHTTALLQNVAPTLRTALTLPAPFDTIAATVASGAIGRFGGPPGTASEPAPEKLDPERLAQAIEDNAGDPAFTPALLQAERDLRRYEGEAGLRFADIARQGRDRPGTTELRSGIGIAAFRWGMGLVLFALASLVFVIGGAIFLVSEGVQIPENRTDLAIAAFGLIGTAVGFINGLAGTVIAFYYGSSQGSKDKTDAMRDSIKTFGDRLAERRAEAPPPAPPAPAPTPAPLPVPEPDMREAATPAAFGLDEILPRLTAPHRQFDGSVLWRLTPGGVSVDDAAPERSPGAPRTIGRIWAQHGALCAEWARSYNVPVELIVATIATESGGDRTARRAEPHRQDQSVGLMQTLVSTARWVLGREGIGPDDLLTPALSIEAGTAYIAKQRGTTWFDPPKVAAAYNAGSVYENRGEGNRWKMRCYPIGTGDHIDRFVQWFGDAMHLSAREDWSDGGRVPSFAAATGGEGRRDQDEGPEGASALALAEARPLSRLSADKATTRALQERLSALGYLDPPSDGLFGAVSTWALGACCARLGLPLEEEVTPAIAAALAEDTAPLPLPQFGSWYDRVIGHMTREGYWICRAPGARNIVYLEGVSPGGVLNDDAPNAFNDLRTVFWVDEGGAAHLEEWEATTEPGRHFTERPMRPEGAARIAFGQYKAWSVGMHRGGKPGGHEALCQVRELPVHRDLDANYMREGDRVETGLFGINQHWGYDNPVSDIGRASAGCLVGRTRDGHRAFMDALKADPRFEASRSYTFLTTILPGRAVLG